jgi:FtsP/CotA-like multicopper oxidase with cupredoxin domain
MLVFNGQFPGPPIVANWGDTIQISVTNGLPDNGTSVHWHGMRQLHSNQMDGTNGITECPIAPGETKVYTFKATTYGSSWYHAHYSVQYGDGLIGTIQINGPSAGDYDVDLGVIPLTDWYHEPMFTLLASHPAAPPTSQSLLVNGTGGNGQLQTIELQPGKKHLLRVVNVGINNFLHFGIDQHTMTVIAADMNPIEPFTTTSLSLTVGKYYSLFLEPRCSNKHRSTL